jgi:hypothetical protein
MHLIVPFAAPWSEEGRHALHTLKLPGLEALLKQLTPVARDEGDAYSFSPPHERALARALGLSGGDGQLPWGAVEAAAAGIETGDLAWARLTPAHWEVSADGVHMSDPALLDLHADEAEALFDAIRPLFESEGAAIVHVRPLQWHAAHGSLASLRTASLDRVVGREIGAWLPEAADAKLMRRLQNEVQMLLYTHAVNEAREARGELPVNTFWFSGCGVAQPVSAPAPRVDDRLRAPALAGDWAAWAGAWTALDAELSRLRDTPLTLDLCGERSAVQYATRPRSLIARLAGTLRGGSALALLESL